MVLREAHQVFEREFREELVGENLRVNSRPTARKDRPAASRARTRLTSAWVRRRPAEASPLSPRAPQSGHDALADQAPLELRDGGEDVEQKPGRTAWWCPRQRHETSALSLIVGLVARPGHVIGANARPFRRESQRAL